MLILLVGSCFIAFLRLDSFSTLSSGKRRTQCFVHLFKILPCSGTYIWCHWVYNCYRYMVYGLCDGWVASWTGSLTLCFAWSDNLFFQHFLNYFLALVVIALLPWQPLFPGESGVDQLVEIIKVMLYINSTLSYSLFYGVN